MYREEILDLYKNPRNTGKLDDALEAEGENSSCGDSTYFYVKVEGGEIKDIRHETEACAICTAACSVTSRELKGKRIEDINDLEKEWIIEQLNVEISPMRVKCAVLGLKTVQKALSKKENPS